MNSANTRAKHRLTKGRQYRAIEEPCYGPYARLSRKRCLVLDRAEGYYSHDFVTGPGRRLPRVTVKFGKDTFYNVAVRTKGGVEFVDLLDGVFRVVAKLS